MTITAAADGSALGNPGPAGWAWYVDDSCWGAGGWKHATNNQGELKAVLELFRATKHLDDDLLVLCDSQYVINSVTKWMRGWKAKGWRKSDGKPVLNLELLQEIDAELVGRKYRFEWVKGHANHPLNEAADLRARTAAESFQRGRPAPAGPGFPGSQSAPAAAQKAAEPSAAARVQPAHPELFDFDADTDTSADPSADAPGLTVPLTPDQHARLAQRARAAGVRPEQFLADLI
jgi:ribonuclease HI